MHAGKELGQKLASNVQELSKIITNDRLPVASSHFVNNLDNLTVKLKRTNVFQLGREVADALTPFTGEWAEEYGSTAYAKWKHISKDEVAQHKGFEDFLKIQYEFEKHKEKYNPGQRAEIKIHAIVKHLRELIKHHRVEKELRNIYQLLDELQEQAQHLANHNKLEYKLIQTNSQPISLSETTEKLLLVKLKHIKIRTKHPQPDRFFTKERADAKVILEHITNVISMLTQQ